MEPLRLVRVGSRKSPLAVAQTEEALRRLRPASPGTTFEIVTITTGGDRAKDAPLLSLGRGSFVKDIEQALLDDRIDFAVHRAKVMTSSLPDGLKIKAVGRRQDPRDIQVNRWGVPLSELKPGARFGTSSPRRTAQLKALRPDLEALPIRGNVGTRLDKVGGDEYDGVILAAAGLIRLGRESEVTEYLSTAAFTPDVGQGTLAAEFRDGDSDVAGMLAAVEDSTTAIALQAERAFLTELGGGCKVPVAAHATVNGDELHVAAMAAVPDGTRVFRAELKGSTNDAATAGRRIAQSLLETGAREII